MKKVLTWLGIQLIKYGLICTKELLKDLEYKGKGEYQYIKKNTSYTENEL